MNLCIDCGESLTQAQRKNKNKRCILCITNKRIEYLVSEEFINDNFSEIWSKNIYLRYKYFLEENKIGKENISKFLKKASEIFLEAEKNFYLQNQISLEWINDVDNKINSKYKPSLKSFLTKEKIISPKDEEKLLDESVQKRINNIPEEFRRLIEIYYNEKKFVKEKQIKQNSRKQLSLKTIENDISVFLRLLKWVNEHYPKIISWELLQEKHVHSFLLSLPIRNREIIRKKLIILFKLAKKKRLITHIPIVDIPAREYPISMECLTMEEKKKLAVIIRKNISIEPLSSFLTSLCFYHGLSSKEISTIKINHIDLEKKYIYINGRPPVYLINDDLINLQNYAKERSEIKNIDKKTYLFVSKAYSYEDKPVSKGFINKYVKELTGYTPKKLRITCFSTLSSMYGPQYLIEAFGLSLTQSSRYGKMEEFLIEEEIRDQREDFLNYSKKLNK